MKIDQQTNNFVSNSGKSDLTETETENKNNEKKEKEKDITIFAGDLNMNEDPIAKKRKEAQEKALKVVGDAFDNDKKIDDDLKERRNHISKLSETIGDAKSQILEFEKRKLDLKESYGIEDDSQEQKDLELLEKESASKKIGSNVELSKEEEEQLSEIHKAGLTEYQDRCLELDKYVAASRDVVKESEKKIIVENATITGIKLERLKSSPMVDAVKEAEGILDAASDEITGMLLDEAKEHIDEKAKEEQEEAEKKAEEKEKQEEQLEAVKEKREEMEKLTNPEKAEEKGTDESDREVNNEIPIDNILEMTHKESDIKKEVENIVDKMKLVAEDIKGAVVDSKL